MSDPKNNQLSGKFSVPSKGRQPKSDDIPTRNWTGSKAQKKGGSFYGVEQNDDLYVKRFKLIFRDGKQISVPYALLPVITYITKTGVSIKTGDLDIIITGRALDRLADYLNDERITWIKESPSDTDTMEEDIFISKIFAEGDLI